MKRKFFALVLCFLMAVSLFPATANATVLSGMTSKVDYDNTDANKYTIDIDLTNQIITVYDNYSGAVVLQGLCTTGSDKYPSGSGQFKLGSMKERFGYFVAYGQYAQYWSQVVRGVYIHSVMYDSKKLTSMSKSAYNNLGKNVSHGCIRVLPEVAQFIFYNCPPGTACNLVFRAKNAVLVKQIKSSMVSYRNYKQPTDGHADPMVVPATVRYNSVPVRTGFSTSKDKTLTTLNAGEHVDLLQLSPNWCKVRTARGTLGYVKTVYLLCDPDTVQTTTGYVATAKTYVYAKASTSSTKLKAIPSGSTVTVTQQVSASWMYGEFGGVTGYVRTKYVKLKEVLVYPVLDGSYSASSSTSSGTVTAGSSARIADGIIANFRSAPNGAIIGELAAGTPVSILSVSGNWYYCNVNGTTGYLYTSCISAN